MYRHRAEREARKWTIGCGSFFTLLYIGYQTGFFAEVLLRISQLFHR